jgi:hypothetical protein
MSSIEKIKKNPKDREIEKRQIDKQNSFALYGGTLSLSLSLSLSFFFFSLRAQSKVQQFNLEASASA